MRVLFVSLCDDMGTDRLVSEMTRAGAECAVLGPGGCVAGLPRGLSRTFAIPSGWRATFALSRALREVAAAWAPDRVVPLDDLASTLLRSLAVDPAQPSDIRRLCLVSFGDPRFYAATCERVPLMHVATAAGVRVPGFASATGRLGRRETEAMRFPVMVKRDQSSGSGGVVRVDDPDRLATAVWRSWMKSAAKALLARLMGVKRAVTPVLIQTAIEGRLAMFTAVCRGGVLIDGAGLTATETHPVKGSSTILRNLPHVEMADAASRLIAALGCSGFVSFDFIIDHDDRAFLIEMNPRPIGSAHLGRRFGHDLVAAYLTGVAQNPGSPVETRDVALFPKELERDPTGLRLAGRDVDHDVPVHEPAVVAAYLRRLIAEHPAHAATLAHHCGSTDTIPRDAAFGDIQAQRC